MLKLVNIRHTAQKMPAMAVIILIVFVILPPFLMSYIII